MRDIPGIPDRAFGTGAGKNNHLYLPVQNPTTGKIWLNNNLGAAYAKVDGPDFNLTQQATSRTDTRAYGSMYQWGRLTDGHEQTNRYPGDGVTNPAVNRTRSATDVPGHGDYIRGVSSVPADWRATTNDNLWQGVNGINNPCPHGFRLPTYLEWDVEDAAWSSSYNSFLRLTVVGYRSNANNSNIYNIGTHGAYWSSTISPMNATSSQALFVSPSSSGESGRSRDDGYAIRCVQD